MTWGPYWMFYVCPECGTRFKYTLENISEDYFGKCISCGAEGTLVAESRDMPKDAEDYEDGYYRY